MAHSVTLWPISALSQCGEAERQGSQIIAGRMVGFPIFFDRAEQLGHCPIESVWEPFRRQVRYRNPLFRIECDRLLVDIRPHADQCSPGTDDHRTILRATTCISSKNNGRLHVRILDNRMAGQRWLGTLGWSAVNRGLDLSGFYASAIAMDHIEPMDAEIEKQQVVHVVKRRIGYPIVIPVHRHVDADHIANQPSRDSLPRIADMRRPAAVLVHRQFHTLSPGGCHQLAAFIQIGHERFLAQDMLSCLNRLLNQWPANFWMRGNVDDIDIGTIEQLAGGREDLGATIKSIAILLARCTRGSANATT